VECWESLELSLKRAGALEGPLLVHCADASVSDDIASLNPWTARGIEIRGQVQVLQTAGKLGPMFDPRCSASGRNGFIAGELIRTIRLNQGVGIAIAVPAPIIPILILLMFYYRPTFEWVN
jgi:hypothetical protein